MFVNNNFFLALLLSGSEPRSGERTLASALVGVSRAAASGRSRQHWWE